MTVYKFLRAQVEKENADAIAAERDWDAVTEGVKNKVAEILGWPVDDVLKMPGRAKTEMTLRMSIMKRGHNEDGFSLGFVFRHGSWLVQLKDESACEINEQNLRVAVEQASGRSLTAVT
jgi:hypothetical protein